MTARELRDLFEGLDETQGWVLFSDPDDDDELNTFQETWADAELEAADALYAWRMNPGAKAYAVYRAAADRASAAQDALRRNVAETGRTERS